MKIKRERMIIAISAVLVIVVIVLAAYLTGLLGRYLNDVLSDETAPTSAAIKFDFEAYERLGF
jgi:hypothetical protein